jgi:hypothetical protein
LTSPMSERTWTRLGPEFGSDPGKVAIVVCALCGLKSASTSFRNHLANHMREMGRASCKADADGWVKPKTRPDNAFQRHLCMCCHVDDVLATCHNVMTQMQQINKKFPLKAGSVGDPNICLGAELRKVTLKNGVHQAQSMSLSKPVQEAVKNVKNCLQGKEPGRPWLKKVTTPFVKGCLPEIDLSPELGSEDAFCHMSPIGALRWMVEELGRVDVIAKTSTLSL